MKALFFDDEPFKCLVFAEILKEAWGHFQVEAQARVREFADEPLELDVFQDAINAREAILSQNVTYPLFFLDLIEVDIENDTYYNRGKELAELVRSIDYGEFQPAIIAISGADHSQSTLVFKEEFERAARLPRPGKHDTYSYAYVSKPAKNEISVEELGQILCDVISDAGDLWQ